MGGLSRKGCWSTIQKMTYLTVMMKNIGCGFSNFAKIIKKITLFCPFFAQFFSESHWSTNQFNGWLTTQYGWLVVRLVFRLMSVFGGKVGRLYPCSSAKCSYVIFIKNWKFFSKGFRPILGGLGEGLCLGVFLKRIGWVGLGLRKSAHHP